MVSWVTVGVVMVTWPVLRTAYSLSSTLLEWNTKHYLVYTVLSHDSWRGSLHLILKFPHCFEYLSLQEHFGPIENWN